MSMVPPVRHIAEFAGTMGMGILHAGYLCKTIFSPTEPAMTSLPPPCTDDILAAPDSTTVCHCNAVSKGEYLALMRQGHLELDQLKRLTAADGLHCATRSPLGRCCTPEIVRLLRHHKGMLPMS